MRATRRGWQMVVPVSLGVTALAGMVACSGGTTTTTPIATGAPNGASSTSAATGTSGTASPPVSLTGTVNDHGTKDLTSSGSSVDLSMEADDNYFGPTFVQVTPGATVHVEIENEGTRNHTFTVDGTGVDAALAPGAKATLDVPVPASGTVAFYCRIHKSSGMQGAFFTSASAAGGATPTTARTTTPTTAATSGRGGY